MPARALWEWLLGRQFAHLDYVLLDPDLTLVSWAEELIDTRVKEKGMRIPTHTSAQVHLSEKTLGKEGGRK